MCYTVVLSSLLDPLYVSCFNVPVCAHSMLLEAAGERDREYLSLTVLVVELMYLCLGTDLIPEVVGIPENVVQVRGGGWSCKRQAKPTAEIGPLVSRSRHFTGTGSPAVGSALLPPGGSPSPTFHSFASAETVQSRISGRADAIVHASTATTSTGLPLYA